MIDDVIATKELSQHCLIPICTLTILVEWRYGYCWVAHSHAPWNVSQQEWQKHVFFPVADVGPFLNFRNAFPFPFLLEKRNAFPFFIPSWKKECIPIPIPWKKEWFFFPFFFHSFLPKKSWENRPKKLAVFYNGSGLTLGDLKYRFHQKIQSSFWFIGSIGPLNKAILRIFST